MQLIPKNWAKFQHYKDRCPPWIKLHRDLLNDRHFICLPTASKALAPMLWLLASESHDGSFDATPEELEFRLRMSRDEIVSGLKSLIDNGFFVDASTMLAPCLQTAIPEREGETERETETKGEKRQKRSVAKIDASKPVDVSDEVWASYKALRSAKRAPITDLVLLGLRREAVKARISFEEAMTVCCERGWLTVKAEWLERDRNQNQQRLTASQAARATAYNSFTHLHSKPQSSEENHGRTIDATPLLG